MSGRFPSLRLGVWSHLLVPKGATVQDQGYVVADGPHGRTMVVRGAWTEAASAELHDGGIETLQLNDAHGFAERSLDFFDAWPIRRLELLARTITDLSPLYRLAGSLEDVSVESAPTASLDLARLPRLRRLSIGWRQVRDTVANSWHLQRLNVTDYSGEDLIPLVHNVELRSISLTLAPRLTSLTGVETLQRVSELRIAHAHRLPDLAALAGHLPDLSFLAFETCGGINSLAPLAGRIGLEELWVANCGPIDSLNPLRGMSDLRRLMLYESTRVTDGDLTPLSALPNLSELRMKQRPHYRPTVAEVSATLTR